MTKKILFRSAWVLGLAIAVALTVSAALSEKKTALSDVTTVSAQSPSLWLSPSA
ncbi:MAG: hypothetical protein JW793_06125 [Acidobacteria bacterium]|nr:hypothetical protein [Acidobacteriota bacterium]